MPLCEDKRLLAKAGFSGRVTPVENPQEYTMPHCYSGSQRCSGSYVRLPVEQGSRGRGTRTAKTIFLLKQHPHNYVQICDLQFQGVNVNLQRGIIVGIFLLDGKIFTSLVLKLRGRIANISIFHRGGNLTVSPR
jgi:hypothetical protein